VFSALLNNGSSTSARRRCGATKTVKSKRNLSPDEVIEVKIPNRVRRAMIEHALEHLVEIAVVTADISHF